MPIGPSELKSNLPNLKRVMEAIDIELRNAKPSINNALAKEMLRDGFQHIRNSTVLYRIDLRSIHTRVGKPLDKNTWDIIKPKYEAAGWDLAEIKYCQRDGDDLIFICALDKLQDQDNDDS